MFSFKRQTEAEKAAAKHKKELHFQNEKLIKVRPGSVSRAIHDAHRVAHCILSAAFVLAVVLITSFGPPQAAERGDIQEVSTLLEQGECPPRCKQDRCTGLSLCRHSLMSVVHWW
eukprot:SAG11_NODE_263_length_11526_cov_23.830314_11_plen_115_part_00